MCHDHAPGEAHVHAHAHSHAGSLEETVAVLSYMLDHNRHHAQELEEIAQKLEQAGHGEAAQHVRAAVVDFGHGNEKLAGALAHLK